MNVKFLTLGCKVNQYETEAMQRLFELVGYSVVEELERADVVVINTCAVTSVAAQKSRQMIRRAARRGAVVAVVGCYAQESPTEIEADVVIGTKDRSRIVELVETVLDQKNKYYPDHPPLATDVVDDPNRRRSPSLEASTDKAVSYQPSSSAASDFISDQRHSNVYAFQNHQSDRAGDARSSAATRINIVGEVGETFEELPHVPSRTRAFIKIEDGCDQRCAYCIIPKLRGSVRSRSLQSIRAECAQLHSLGFREIVLTGIHLGAYGKDCGLQLIDAVQAALESGKPSRLRLSSLEATEVHDDLIELLKADRRLCRHLHLPLQSGCDDILRAMRRPYSTRQFARLVERLAVEVPDISLTTDLIVGFPGETAQLFEQTVQFVEAMPLSKLHVFPYSVRRGTVAASMPEQIPSEIKRERVARMLEISNRKSIECRKKFIGSTVEVLTETLTDGVVDGLTDNYIRVFIDDIDGRVPIGELVEVALVGLKDDGVVAKPIDGCSSKASTVKLSSAD